MDEATSALDNETEAALTAAIRALSGHKTIVVIAHRQASLAGCDTVVSI
jgi:ABC-type bacteriocin/lantibiotic exporter with double-glycine peptidase domain